MGYVTRVPASPSNAAKDEMSARVERRFSPTPESAVAARRFVGSAVQGTSVDRDNALLLTSELVNNAIMYAQSEFEVRVSIEDEDAVRVAVVNHAPQLLLLSREPSAEGGRGLALIDQLASAWGFERRADMKLVWFLLAAADATA
jgi:sigma-B regulation protein RsbU (phosphoserine phosphatase)